MSGPVANLVDRKLPHRIQMFVALYGSWLARMRQSPAEEGARSHARRLVRFLLIDVVLLAAVIIGASLELERVRGMLRLSTGISEEIAGFIVLGLAVVVALPLIFGAVRSARQLGATLALRALPLSAAGKADLAAAPRRVLVVTLQVAIVLLVGVPLVAITQPFVPPLGGAVVLVAVITMLGFTFWRSATNLHGHARAGAELIVSLLGQQMSNGVRQRDESADSDEQPDAHALDQVDDVLPGLGEPRLVRIDPRSEVVDRTLADVDLRGLTGATALAIMRAGQPVLVPDGHDLLREGDLVALAGTRESVESASRLLRAMPQEEQSND
jgi:CPA2 family monovalent cation:H+ antiporter-2